MMKKGIFLQDIFGEVISSTTSHKSDIYEYNNVKVDTEYDTDPCVEIIDNDLAIDEGNVGHIDSILFVLMTKLQIKVDKLVWKHIKYHRTGLLIVFNRNAQFHTKTMEVHANDFLQLLSAAVQCGRTCIVCVVDNRPDMNPTNFVNEFLVQSQTFTLYSAGQSAYYMIEHAWSPLSNCLTSVKLPG